MKAQIEQTRKKKLEEILERIFRERKAALDMLAKH